MAAEAQRAPSVRGQSNYASALPAIGRLQPAVTALASIDVTDPLPSLGIFARVPDGCDVVPIRGHVAIVERSEITTDDLIEGGLFVYERQIPIAMCPAPDARRECTRLVVRVYRDTRVEGAWRTRDMERPHRPGDGPFHAWGLAGALIGRVIGVYQPKAVTK